MEKFSATLYAEMNSDFNRVALESESILQQAERNYYVADAALQKLRTFIAGYVFKNEDEEIQFFKVIKPLFLSELIYNLELYHFELHKPVGDRDTMKNYYREITDHLKVFFDRNNILYTYYKTGKTIYDKIFFLKASDHITLTPEYSQDPKDIFSTVHSVILSKLVAYENLNTYLQQGLYTLDHPEYLAPTAHTTFNGVWTDSKAALIELAYALHARGAVNFGKADVKQIISGLEQLFKVKLGNFYRTFQGMRIRKKNRTAFLDTLKESLEKKMDDADLNF